MSAYQISSSDLMELTDLPAQIGASVSRASKYRDQVGIFEASAHVFPNLIAMSLKWDIKKDMVIKEDDDSNFVTINFQVKGRLESDFCNVHPLSVDAGTHNLLWSDPAQHTHQIAGHQQLEMLHLAIDKNYFTQLIGTDDRWAEATIEKLDKQEPFLATAGTTTITPAMFYLVQSIRETSTPGAVRNLQLQSRIFELLSLQFDQFRTETNKGNFLTAGDKDKLHALRLYIDNHFLDQLDLFSLSRISMMNEFKLKKGFKELFNQTIFTYIRELKMQYALRLLADRAMTVEEIAYQLGYEHAQHFSTSFKKHFGQSPSSWYKSR